MPSAKENLSKTLTLNNGFNIPIIGLGVYLAEIPDCYNICKEALKLGYRHIDSAAFYKNEADVGRAVRESGIPRSEIFVTTKIFFLDGEGADTTKPKIEECLKNLDIEYIDLLLIHAPFVGKRLPAWKVMEDYVNAGKVKSIGVSNYGIKHIDELLQNCTIKPVVNQIELHPFLQLRDLVSHCQKLGIHIQAYSPIVKAKKLDDPVVMEVAMQVNKTPAQVLIAWGVAKGCITLPKTVTPKRLEPNADVFFEIPKDCMDKLDGLECAMSTGWEPQKWA